MKMFLKALAMILRVICLVLFAGWGEEEFGITVKTVC